MPENSTYARKLLVVYHSQTNGTRQMVDALEKGVLASDDIKILIRHASQTVTQDLLDADGYVFATPENLASMSGMLKDFFDRTYYGALDRIQGRPYGILICAGSDGENAARQIERIATGWRLKLIQPALIVNTQAQTPEAILAQKTLTDEQLEPCETLGSLFAAGLSMSIF
ncbi:flavodoxin family protein [Orrella sp. 11846]|uniref:flavodoxin family protein n=1 Tax=Orrella sp. 11846 TaxID=3409913 RepID=UPI003B5BB303